MTEIGHFLLAKIEIRRLIVDDEDFARYLNDFGYSIGGFQLATHCMPTLTLAQSLYRW